MIFDISSVTKLNNFQRFCTFCSNLHSISQAIVPNGKIGLFLNSSFQNFYAYIPWIAVVPRYKCTRFKVACLQITMILPMSLLRMEQGFYMAMCTCITMRVPNAKLIMSSNDKKMMVGFCCHGNKVFKAKSHIIHYYCPKRHMYQMPSREAMRLSPCCHGSEVSVVKSHTMDQYCAKETEKRN